LGIDEIDKLALSEYFKNVDEYNSGNIGKFVKKHFPKLYNRKITKSMQYQAWTNILGTPEYYNLSPMNQLR